ncbi:MAG: hypothetical protein ABW133_21845 [Polyangiaceae bacterium]
MDNSEKPACHSWQNALILSAISALAAFMPACSYGDPCLRTTDCGSGLICSEGKCIVDPGDNPSDGSPPSDVIVSVDASTSDGATRDTTSIPDTSSDTATPPADSSSDSTSDPAVDSRDGTSDGDSASLDVTQSDGTDARAAADISSDTNSGDVGNAGDGGMTVDAIADAVDAAG